MHDHAHTGTRHLAIGLVFGAFLLVLTGGVILAAAALADIDRAPEGSLRTGEWTTRLEASFEESLPIYEPALHLWTALRYALFREGGPGLVVGSDGWLFTAEELATGNGAGGPAPAGNGAGGTAPAGSRRIDEAAAYVADARTELAGRGSALAVVLLPAKARIYEDKLPGGELPEPVDRRYEAALETFRRASRSAGGAAAGDALPGFAVIDPRAGLRTARAAGTEVFLRTDTHWTPAGAAAVADAVAGGVERIIESRDVPRTRFESQPVGSVTHHGDLLRFLPLGPFAETLGPEPDTITRLETVRAGGDGAGGDGSSGLFDDPSIPVTLVGTSYSAGELWNFPGALSDALEVDVLQVAAEGEGPFAPMAEYLAGDTIGDQPPQLVIWEIPERYVIAPPARAR